MKKEYKHPFIARLMHWTWVILMLILILTGVYIHEPSWMPIFPERLGETPFPNATAAAWPENVTIFAFV